MNEREYLVCLCAFTPFGPARINLLISYFESAEKVWNASKSKLLEVGLKERIAGEFVNHRKNFDSKKYFKKLKEKQIKFVSLKDANYPENLRGISDAPSILYYIGELKKSDKNAVAIVGSRKMSGYGREVADKFATELSIMGITIVSGLALGIDAVAHKACVEAGGRGIVVLASGLDTISPLTNRWIALEIVKKGGAIISEYPLGQTPQRTFFPSRNRIISGLSKAVIVVEGLRKSGTLLTASAAAEQGRTVFAVPGYITSPLSAAPHFLIQNGSKLITSTQDILEELDMQLKVDFEEVEKIMPENEMEEKLLEIIGKEPLHLDEVARISSLKASDVSTILTFMELKGMVKNMGGGVYKKV